MSKDLKITFSIISLSMMCICLLIIGHQNNQGPIEYLTSIVKNNTAKQKVVEPPTGNTSKKNKDAPKKSYEETIKNLDKESLSTSDLQNLVDNNGTLIIQISGSKNDQLLKDVGQKQNKKIYLSSTSVLQKYNKSAGKYQIVATPGSVIFLKGGLITSMFDSNAQKKKNISKNYEKWLTTLKVE